MKISKINIDLSIYKTDFSFVVTSKKIITGTKEILFTLPNVVNFFKGEILPKNFSLLAFFLTLKVYTIHSQNPIFKWYLVTTSLTRCVKVDKRQIKNFEYVFLETSLIESV